LKESGEYGKIQARLRQSVYSLLLKQQQPSEDEKFQPKETWMLNELIRDYLKFHGLKHTLATMEQETGVGGAGDERIDREFLEEQLGLVRSPDTIPLLYSMLNIKK
jgi:hypothetical protein